MRINNSEDAWNAIQDIKAGFIENDIYHFEKITGAFSYLDYLTFNPDNGSHVTLKSIFLELGCENEYNCQNLNSSDDNPYEVTEYKNMFTVKLKTSNPKNIDRIETVTDWIKWGGFRKYLLYAGCREKVFKKLGVYLGPKESKIITINGTKLRFSSNPVSQPNEQYIEMEDRWIQINKSQNWKNNSVTIIPYALNAMQLKDILVAIHNSSNENQEYIVNPDNSEQVLDALSMNLPPTQDSSRIYTNRYGYSIRDYNNFGTAGLGLVINKTNVHATPLPPDYVEPKRDPISVEALGLFDKEINRIEPRVDASDNIALARIYDSGENTQGENPMKSEGSMFSPLSGLKASAGRMLGSLFKTSSSSGANTGLLTTAPARRTQRRRSSAAAPFDDKDLHPYGEVDSSGRVDLGQEYGAVEETNRSNPMFGGPRLSPDHVNVNEDSRERGSAATALNATRRNNATRRRGSAMASFTGLYNSPEYTDDLNPMHRGPAPVPDHLRINKNASDRGIGSSLLGSYGTRVVKPRSTRDSLLSLDAIYPDKADAAVASPASGWADWGLGWGRRATPAAAAAGGKRKSRRIRAKKTLRKKNSNSKSKKRIIKRRK